jgi:hypothetical protein
MERAKLSVLQTSVYKSVTELTSQYNRLTTNGPKFVESESRFVEERKGVLDSNDFFAGFGPPVGPAWTVGGRFSCHRLRWF